MILKIKLKRNINYPQNSSSMLEVSTNVKNLLTILKTLLQLPSHRLVVVGKGKHYKKKCENYIKEHHLESQVLF